MTDSAARRTAAKRSCRLDALGRRAEARDRVRSLLEMWKRGDPDAAILKEAKALAEKLREKTALSRP